MFMSLKTRIALRKFIRETASRHNQQRGYEWAKGMHERGIPSCIIREHAIEFHKPEHIKGAMSYLEENQL